MAGTETHQLLSFGPLTVPLHSKELVADDPLLEVPQLRLKALPVSQLKCFEKGGFIDCFWTVTVSTKLTHKLTKRAVFKTEFSCDILLRSAINKDRSERFVLTVICLSRMRKEIETSRIIHDQASKKEGPGSATEMPSTFMFSATFRRNQMGVGAASAMMMLMTVAAIIIPYLYSELKDDGHGH